MKLASLTTVVACSLLAFNAFAQQPPTTGSTPGSEPGMSTTGKSAHHADLRASKAIGSEVKTAQGEKLGKINDFILNSSNGRVDFVVLDWNNKLVPVPFSLLTASMTGGRSGFLSPTGSEYSFTANVDTTKLQNAPTIDKSRWSDIQQPGWSQRIFSYYGVSSEGMGAPGTEKGSGMGTEKGSDTGSDTGTDTKSSKDLDTTR